MRQETMKWWREVSKWRGPGQQSGEEEEEGDGEEEEEKLVEVQLRGKAPWGFTLRGGTEHREPLVITKVEEGSVAAEARVQAGDEMMSVNGVVLGGSRQEAICLVKSSHKALTLVVRRKNGPSSRPHSWHSSKLTEEESEPAAREATSVPVWQPKHEARSKELCTQEEKKVQHQVTAQSNSPNNMERVDRPSHPYPQICLSSTKYMSSTEQPLTGAGGKRDPGFSSGPPVHDQIVPFKKGTSTENIFFKGIQGDGVLQAGRPRYLHPTLGNEGWEGSRTEEPPASRFSISGRTSVGPVWQVPDKKSQSPPPPPPPLRSDSFAATKVFPYSEGPSGSTKSLGRSIEKITEKTYQEKPPEPKHIFAPLSTKDLLHPNKAADHNHNQLHPNKLFSLSSNDVRHSHYTHEPNHQRQYSDESPFYLQTRSAPVNKIQSVGSYYRSLQDLPANVFGRKQVRHSTASVMSSAANPSLDSRHYGAGIKQAFQTEVQGRKPHRVNSNEAGFLSSLKSNVAPKYSVPQSQMPYSENKECNGHSLIGSNLYYEHQNSELSNHSHSPEDSTKRVDGHSNDMNKQFPAQTCNDHKVGLPRQQDPWVPQSDHRISPLKTPLLHSLAQESRSLTIGVMSTQDVGDMSTSSGKLNRRSDRYATTLRKEIQQKRAQLQKSRSAATLTCNAEEEEAEEWRSTQTSTPSGATFSNTYKDHLKEAQARVLQATSFQRRDLEPFGPEVPVVKTSNGRIRGRKRLPLAAKRTHSFSEPDKMDKVGVEREPQNGLFREQNTFLETKPVFSKPVPKSCQTTNLSIDLCEISKERSEETNSTTDLNHLSPIDQQTSEQQRLGTFAEYQAEWTKKKFPEAKIQGRYHSAENILDADPEEKAVCIHEKSRSSPSADFHTQNISSLWREAKVQQSEDTSRVQTVNRLGYKCNHSPQSVPPGPRNEGPDHGTKPNTANPSKTTLSAGPCSLSPILGSQPPQIKGLLPPPRSHLGPETTSSSQEFLPGGQADPAELQPLSSSDTQRHGTAQCSSAGPASASSPDLSGTSAADMSGGDVETEQEKEQLAPASSTTSSSVLIPTADGARSPSPQFAPLRLTDKPPSVSVQDDSPLRLENELKPAEVMDVKSPLRKVPVKIVHTESSSDREGHAYLPQNSFSCSAFKPLPLNSCLGITEYPASSSFSAYTRQAAQDPGPASTSDQESVLELSSAGTLHSEEDAKREELARDIMGKDKSLADILDQSGRKTTMDLMEGLYPSEEQILEGAQQRRRASVSSRPSQPSPRSMDRREEEEEDEVSVSAASSLVPSSSYYNTSAPKAELLIKMKDMQGQLEEQDSEDELDIDLADKKQELISSLARKLDVLREARQSLQEDIEDNEALGRQVEAMVQRLCQPKQLDKFRMFVGDLDKVVSLLLSLSGRLARVENALDSLEDDASPEEKRNLTEKRKLLMRQHEDAKELKENLDRREKLVSDIMAVHLDAESLDDYRHFVKMKSALIIEQRKLEDKIKLGEEQLKCLLDSLPLEQRPLL